MPLKLGKRQRIMHLALLTRTFEWMPIKSVILS